MTNKRSMIVVALVLLLAGSRGYSTSVIYGDIDVPTDGATVPRGSFYIAGWAFFCETGQWPDRPMIALHKVGCVGLRCWWKPISIDRAGPVPRPDVQAAYSGICPAVPEATGYHLYVGDWPPPGEWEMWLGWSMDSGESLLQMKLITITE